MRKALQTWWRQSRLGVWLSRLPRPSRGKALLLNLAIIAVAGVGLWGLADYPLPTAKMEFRRLERASLEERSEIILSLDKGVQALNGTKFSFTRSMVVGETEGQVLVGYASRADGRFDTLRRYERGETPIPIPLYPNMAVWTEMERNGTERGRDHGFETPLLLVDVPQGAVAGRIELTVQDWDGRSGTQGGPLFDLGGGIWLTSLEEPWNPYSSRWCEGGSYTLRLYDETGGLLLEQEGTIPEPS